MAQVTSEGGMQTAMTDPHSPGGETIAQGKSSPDFPATAPALQRFDLFPTRIWQARPASLSPHLDQWIARVMEMRAAHPDSAGRTNRRGWNSQDMSVLEQPLFTPLRAAVRAAP